MRGNAVMKNTIGNSAGGRTHDERQVGNRDDVRFSRRTACANAVCNLGGVAVKCGGAYYSEKICQQVPELRQQHEQPSRREVRRTRRCRSTLIGTHDERGSQRTNLTLEIDRKNKLTLEESAEADRGS